MNPHDVAMHEHRLRDFHARRLEAHGPHRIGKPSGVLSVIAFAAGESRKLAATVERWAKAPAHRGERTGKPARDPERLPISR